MNQEENKNKMNNQVKLNSVISEQAYDSLIREVKRRKLENLSELIESISVELELKRK